MSADLVITDEGRVDAQTLRGKTPAEVIEVARAAGVPGACWPARWGRGVAGLAPVTEMRLTPRILRST